MSLVLANQITGELSKPSKLPCFTYNLPAGKECPTGSKLMHVKGTTCEGCYATRGWYRARKALRHNMFRRLESLKDPKWVEAMVFLIKWYRQAFFRWHDSGEIQSTAHLHKIVQVAEQTPETMHWLPTREYEIIRKYKEVFGLSFPPNLQVLLSAHMREEMPPIELAQRLGVRASGVSSNLYTCLATTKTSPIQGRQHRIWKGHCGSCRLCWDPSVPVIIYRYHKGHSPGRPKKKL